MPPGVVGHKADFVMCHNQLRPSTQPNTDTLLQDGRGILAPRHRADDAQAQVNKHRIVRLLPEGATSGGLHAAGRRTRERLDTSTAHLAPCPTADNFRRALTHRKDASVANLETLEEAEQAAAASRAPTDSAAVAGEPAPAGSGSVAPAGGGTTATPGNTSTASLSVPAKQQQQQQQQEEEEEQQQQQQQQKQLEEEEEERWQQQQQQQLQQQQQQQQQEQQQPQQQHQPQQQQQLEPQAVLLPSGMPDASCPAGAGGASAGALPSSEPGPAAAGAPATESGGPAVTTLAEQLAATLGPRGPLTFEERRAGSMAARLLSDIKVPGPPFQFHGSPPSNSR